MPDRTIAIAELKAHLSAEIKRAGKGEAIIILDHKKPVARLSGLETSVKYTQRSKKIFEWKEFKPLLAAERLQAVIDAERSDSW